MRQSKQQRNNIIVIDVIQNDNLKLKPLISNIKKHIINRIIINKKYIVKYAGYLQILDTEQDI